MKTKIIKIDNRSFLLIFYVTRIVTDTQIVTPSSASQKCDYLGTRNSMRNPPGTKTVARTQMVTAFFVSKCDYLETRQYFLIIDTNSLSRN